jgi:hypothetical protein
MVRVRRGESEPAVKRGGGSSWAGALKLALREGTEIDYAKDVVRE